MPTKSQTKKAAKAPAKKQAAKAAKTEAKAPVTPPRPLPSTTLTAALQIPTGFVINEVPVQPGVAPPAPADIAPGLGPLKAFTGEFIGNGFNMIFRPQNSATPTKLPVPQPGSDNILELNLTIESLAFRDPLGAVPNRGEVEGDIFLNGVPYLQAISDVTDPKNTTPIHLEPGLWVIIPPTAHPAESDATFARMASIPHGTTINAQGTTLHVNGGPKIDPVDITPFPIGNPGSRIRFPSQTVSNTATPRVPQDLSSAPAITQALLDDPNSLLRAHIEGMNIVATDVIIIDTQSAKVPGGGTDNIGFLVGDNGSGPNANAVQMTAIFWIETVQVDVTVGPLNAGETQTVSPTVPAGAPVPKFAVTSASELGSPRTVTVTYPQIQYTQNVSLNFATLTWPHVSVATLAPAKPIAVNI
jgi:hypothetical protein